MRNGSGVGRMAEKTVRWLVALVTAWAVTAWAVAGGGGAWAPAAGEAAEKVAEAAEVTAEEAPGSGQSLVIEAGRRITSFNQPEIDLVIFGTVSGPVRAANVELLEGGYVGGNIDVSPDGTAEIYGRVVGNVIARNITLGPEAIVGGTIIHLGGSLSISPAARYNAISTAGGSTKDPEAGPRSGMGYFSADELGRILSYYLNDGSELAIGTYPVISIPSIQMRVPQRAVREEPNYLALFLLWLGFLLGSACLAVLALVFFRQTVGETVGLSEREPVRALLVGFLGLILLPVIMVLAAVTIVGIPLLPVMVVTFILAVTVGFIGEGVFLGRNIGRLLAAGWSENDFLTGLLGLFIMLHLVFVPVVGWAIIILLALMGYGAVLIWWYPIWQARLRRRGARTAADADSSGGSGDAGSAGGEQ